MLFKQKFYFVNANGKKTVVDEAGNPADLQKIISKHFSPVGEDAIPVILIAGTDTHDRIAFDIKTAGQIVSNKVQGYVSTEGDRKVRILTLKAAGDYPVVGMDADGFPRTWSAEGKESTGKEELSLFLNIKKKEEPKQNPQEEE